MDPYKVESMEPFHESVTDMPVEFDRADNELGFTSVKNIKEDETMNDLDKVS